MYIENINKMTQLARYFLTTWYRNLQKHNHVVKTFDLLPAKVKLPKEIGGM